MDCPRCRGLKVVHPSFVEETQKALADLLAELVIWANENKVDHRKMPVLTKIAKAIRNVEML